MIGGERLCSGGWRRVTLTQPLPIAGTLKIMIRRYGNAAVGVVIASLLDKYFYGGHYAGAALIMLRQIRQAFGF